MNEQANALAHHLIASNLQQEELVGILIEPSLERMIGLLAILKAGGAFVPLDTDLPNERLNILTEGIGFLVTRPEHIRDLECSGIKIIDLNSFSQGSKLMETANPTGLTRPHSLAYQIYTSGSTGKPKGVIDSNWSGKQGIRLLSAGEALPLALSRELLTRCDQLWNLYGPTETTVYSTQSLMGDELDYVPIGRPVANTHCYVLGDNLRPVPVGVSGQLYIGGVGLARGYRNQPELTNTVFIENPSRENPGERLYATGDLVRWRRRYASGGLCGA